jgi:hypothetical protein
MVYNLTPGQKNLLRWMVSEVRANDLDEEFTVIWVLTGQHCINGFRGDTANSPDITRSALDALKREGLIDCAVNQKQKSNGTIIETSRRCSVTGKGYEAIDTDFAAPDMSFIRHLDPLAEVSGLDDEIVKRCLPALGAGASDPANWDSAVRTCGVLFEERLRKVGRIADSSCIGRDLVNATLGEKGTLAGKFANGSERMGYRDLFAGIVGAFRNPSAHRIVDPSPADGGAFIAFVNMLLRKLEKLR